MDVFKLTFETTIVGISAFLWLGIALHLVSPNVLVRAKAVLAGANQSLAAAVLLSCAYCLGSAILPISEQLVNDEHWFLPEDSVRCRVALEETTRLRLFRHTEAAVNVPGVETKDCESPFWSQVFHGNNRVITKLVGFLMTDHVNAEGSGEKQREIILTGFELSQSRTLGQGSEKEEVFKQLRERVTVLRGAFFSGFVSLWICVFGCIAVHREQPSNRVRKALGIMLAAALTLFAMYSGYKDLTNPSIFDLPILECVFGTITIFGGYLVVKGVRRPRFLRAHFVMAIVLCAGLSYGGWMWSEIIYDQQVITSSAVLQGMPSSVRQVGSGNASSEAPPEESVERVPEDR